MNKAELWDELKKYLIKEVPRLYNMSWISSGCQKEARRLETKATGMDLVLQKMEELERSLLDD
jgi:hypothetical protein